MRHSSIYGLVGYIIPAAIMFISYPVLVSELGSEVFGVYTLAMAVSGSAGFMDLGVSSAMIKFIAEDRRKNNTKSIANILISSLFFSLCMGVILVLIVWAVTPWLISLFQIKEKMRADVVWTFRLASFQVLMMFLMKVCLGLFRGFQRFDLSAFILSSLSVLTYGGIVIGILLFGAGLVEVVIISIGATAVVLIFSFSKAVSFCKTHGIPLIKGNMNIAVCNRMLSFGSAMTVMSIAGMLNSELQRIMLGILAGPQSVAAFHLGTFVPAKVNGATMAMSEPLFPKVASKGGRYDKELNIIYRRYMVILFLVSTVMLTPFIFAPEMIYSIWLGASIPEYTPEIASIFSIGLLINVLGQPAYHFFNGMGKPWLNTAFSFANPLFLYVGLSYLYIVNGRVDALDFARATTFSLAAGSFIYVVWYELAMRKQLKNNTILTDA